MLEETRMREIDIDRAGAVHADGATFVDVREPQEFREGRIPGALNLPMGRLMSRLDELDRSRPVYVVCATGNRSGAMTDLLSASGFDAVNVAGGTQAWASSGRPIEK